MMISTHVLMGANLGLIIGMFEPSLGTAAIAAGVLGSIIPDLDMMAEHHRTLHRPFQFLGVTGALYLIFTATASNLAAFTLFTAAAASLHSFSDILSQGKTKHPEVKKDERAVYNHLGNKWMKPKRIINEASSRDLAATTILAIPLLTLLDGGFAYLTVLAVTFGCAQHFLRDWFTKHYLSDYDRYSEFFQHKIGFGPETGTTIRFRKIPQFSRQLVLHLFVPVRDRVKS
jgi:hypothetical protein